MPACSLCSQIHHLDHHRRPHHHCRHHLRGGGGGGGRPANCLLWLNEYIMRAGRAHACISTVIICFFWVNCLSCRVPVRAQHSSSIHPCASRAGQPMTCCRLQCCRLLFVALVRRFRRLQLWCESDGSPRHIMLPPTGRPGAVLPRGTLRDFRRTAYVVAAHIYT